MDHFLITRFNIKVKDWQKTRDGHLVNDPSWLEDRFFLFERFCLPSVQNQSNQDFKWLVFFDSDTPIHFKQRNEHLSKAYPNFMPKYINGIDSFLPELIDTISSTGNQDYIITSRIDNDDLIHKDLMAQIKVEARPSNELVIDFENGFQLVDRDGYYEVRNYTHYFNPFISLVERRDDFKTVMSRNHRDWKKAKSVLKPDHKYWIEHVHATNKLNSARNNLTLSLKRDFMDFGLNQSVKLPSYGLIALTNFKIKLQRLKIKVQRALLKK